MRYTGAKVMPGLEATHFIANRRATLEIAYGSGYYYGVTNLHYDTKITTKDVGIGRGCHEDSGADREGLKMGNEEVKRKADTDRQTDRRTKRSWLYSYIQGGDKKHTPFREASHGCLYRLLLRSSHRNSTTPLCTRRQAARRKKRGEQKPKRIKNEYRTWNTENQEHKEQKTK